MPMNCAADRVCQSSSRSHTTGQPARRAARAAGCGCGCSCGMPGLQTSMSEPVQSRPSNEFTGMPSATAASRRAASSSHAVTEIGGAACRERVCQYVEISVVAVSLTKKSIEEYVKNRQTNSSTQNTETET